MTLNDILKRRRDRIAAIAAKTTIHEGEQAYCLPVPRGCPLPRHVDGSRLSGLSRLWKTGAEPENIATNPCLEIDKVWDHVFGCPCSKTPIQVFMRRDLPPQHTINEDWQGILSGLNHVGRPSGDGEFLRPTGQWVTDLAVGNAFELVEAAHALVHARAVMARDFSGMQTRFLECLGELLLAQHYNLTFKCPTMDEMLTGKPGTELSDMERFGIKVAITTNLRKPWLTIGMGKNGILSYKDAVVVLYGVHVEPQPWSTRSDNPNDKDESWLEMNRWSCLPSLLSLSGWLGVDEVCKAPLTGYRPDTPLQAAKFALPVTAMEGPSALDVFLAALPRGNPDPSAGIWKVDSFMKSAELSAFLGVTPPFPCKDCLQINFSAEGAPARPVHRRPEHPDKAKPEIVKEWVIFDAQIDKIFAILKKACHFHYCRFVYKIGGKKKLWCRSVNANKLRTFAEKSVSVLHRVNELKKQGRMTDARALEQKLKKSRENMESLFIQTY